MKPIETAQLIEAAGGDLAFAALLGLPKTVNVARRVNNWKRRGLPARVALDHYKTLHDLRCRLDEGTPRQEPEAA